ncbi:MAG: hypothetical protein KKA62_05250, partial [Nanoarchaeota archaeon]|nr:hypothetical protein [Nanoarchaeota archaeon]MBU1977328.1 hypothetical protein [Nanoarchaeota archaeon]
MDLSGFERRLQEEGGSVTRGIYARKIIAEIVSNPHLSSQEKLKKIKEVKGFKSIVLEIWRKGKPIIIEPNRIPLREGSGIFYTEDEKLEQFISTAQDVLCSEEYGGPKLAVIRDTNSYIIQAQSTDESRNLDSFLRDLGGREYIQMINLPFIVKEFLKGGTRSNPLTTSERDGTFVLEDILKNDANPRIKAFMDIAFSFYNQVERAIEDRTSEYLASRDKEKGRINEKITIDIFGSDDKGYRTLIKKCMKNKLKGKADNFIVDALLAT